MRLEDFTPQDRYNHWARKENLTPPLDMNRLRQITSPVLVNIKSADEFIGFMDVEVCPECIMVDKAMGMYKLTQMVVKKEKNPIADKGELITMACLNCGFVEHHPYIEKGRTATEIEMQLRQAQAAMGKQNAAQQAYNQMQNKYAGLGNAAAQAPQGKALTNLRSLLGNAHARGMNPEEIRHIMEAVERAEEDIRRVSGISNQLLSKFDPLKPFG